MSKYPGQYDYFFKINNNNLYNFRVSRILLVLKAIFSDKFDSNSDRK
jgi:hypothetical protein